MDIIRLSLFLGLIIHKLVWEILKVRNQHSDQSTHNKAATPPSLLKRLVKLGKSGVLIFLVIQTLFLNLLPILPQPATIRIIGLVIFLIGLTVAIMGRLQLGDNWANLEDYQVMAEQSLVTKGIYRLIRHPIYGGDILLLVGLELALNSWLVLGAIALLIVIFKQTTEEEKILLKAFPNYALYQKQTKRFIPFII